MEIRVLDKQDLLAPGAVEHTNSKVKSAFAKFGFKIKGVEIFLDDVNGPKGGIDKECRVVVRLNKMDEVVVTAKDGSLLKAISQAIKRAERSVARQIQNRSMRGDDRNSRSSFAFYGPDNE